MKDGFKQPTTLASYDIILTTYAVLMADFHFVDLPDLGLHHSVLGSN